MGTWNSHLLGKVTRVLTLSPPYALMAYSGQLGLYLYTVRFVIAEAECERHFVQLSKQFYLALY
jgi:hypothetical protein